ncbi:MAG: alpha/beta hydrolase [Woeseiaceae bacterium]
MTTLGARFDRWLWQIPSEIPAHAQTYSVDVNASTLRVRDSGGASKALVFLCDPPVTVEAYDDLIASFQPDFRIIVVELPGFGFSRTSSAGQLTFSGAVEAVEAALAFLDFDSIVVFGPCVCGFVAAELAARGKLPINGVVLMQTPDKAGMLAWVERMDQRGLLRIPLIGQLMVKLNSKRLVKFWLKYATAKGFDSRPIASAITDALRRGCGYPLATMLQLWSEGPADARLDVPGLIVWGKQDRSHAETAPECSKAHLTSAEIIQFADCGHFSELERPSEFAASVKPFVDRCFTHVDD